MINIATYLRYAPIVPVVFWVPPEVDQHSWTVDIAVTPTVLAGFDHQDMFIATFT